MRRLLVLGVTCLLVVAAVAQAGPPTASWEGPVGLFTQPTAETLPTHDYALTFSEIRFAQENHDYYNKTTWFTGSVVYAIAPRWEVAVTSRHEVVDNHCYDNDWPDSLIDETFQMGHVKYILSPVCPESIGWAVGVFDITDASRTVSGVDTDRGRRVYLVGTYDWFTLGLAHDGRGLGGFVGAKWAVTERVDLIAEYIYEPMFVQVLPEPNNDVNFNVGLRLYPKRPNGLRFDLAAVGDGRFDFGFSYSFTIK